MWFGVTSLKRDGLLLHRTGALPFELKGRVLLSLFPFSTVCC